MSTAISMYNAPDAPAVGVVKLNASTLIDDHSTPAQYATANGPDPTKRSTSAPMNTNMNMFNARCVMSRCRKPALNVRK